MKTTTKWILGIVISLVILAALMAIGFLVISRWSGATWIIDGRASQLWDGGRAMPWRAMPWRGIPGREMPMHPNWRSPTHWFGGFFPLRMLAGGLIWLGILALIVLGVLTLVRGLRRPQQAAIFSVPATSPTSASAPVSAQAPSNACPNCQRPVQGGWNHCPYCGSALLDNLKNEAPQA